jgi:hypothetical protein
MLKPEEVRVGLLVWWDRLGIQSPCQITEVSEGSFALLSINDTSVPRIHMNSAALHEMRVCTLKDVEQYMEDERKKFEAVVAEKRRELTKAQTHLDNLKETHMRMFQEMSVEQVEPAKLLEAILTVM